MAKRKPRLAFLPLAPAIVLIVGVIAAVAITVIGVGELASQSDHAASLKADLLAQTLARRLQATALEDRASVLERAAGRSGTDLILAGQDGRVEVDMTVDRPSPAVVEDLLVRGRGVTNAGVGRAMFQVEPLGGAFEYLSLVVFVRAPARPPGTAQLVTSVAALSTLLLGIALLFALALARDVRNDVVYVTRHISAMAREGAHPSGKAVVVRSIDQVGELTSGFNVLVDRFTAAEAAYRQDLAGALAYDRDRSAFLAALSHELRTPLNAILGFTDVLLAEVDGPLSDDARENLEVVRNSGGHLKDLIDDILDLSALESGELALSVEDVDLHEIAAEVMREARVGAADKPLVLELQGEHVRAPVDPLRVRQIIGNLVGNAVKFTAEGSVTVRVEPRRRFVAIIVSDTGPGIAPEEQTAIFEEYRQAGDPSARRAGTGLGLAITKRLVQMHGGYIELESEVGRGARFTIVLPVDRGSEART